MKSAAWILLIGVMFGCVIEEIANGDDRGRGVWWSRRRGPELEVNLLRNGVACDPVGIARRRLEDRGGGGEILRKGRRGWTPLLRW
jgi:hypothetical protein